MNAPMLLLTVFGVDLPKSNRSFGKLPGLLLSDVLLILGVGLALLLVLAVLVYYWMKLRRKRRRHISGGEKVYRDSSAADPGNADNPSDDHRDDEDSPDHHHHHHHSRRRYKYRVRRRTHRSRNPTLSETGGLPPLKPQEPSKPV
jgi:ABC-type nickel/cobalt efflux system permease component RcnA